MEETLPLGTDIDYLPFKSRLGTSKRWMVMYRSIKISSLRSDKLPHCSKNMISFGFRNLYILLSCLRFSDKNKDVTKGKND